MSDEKSGRDTKKSSATRPEERFVSGARAHGDRSSGAGATNRAYAKLHRALLELRETPDKGVAFLFSLLNENDLSVATWAALYLLPHREDAAKAALRRVAKRPGLTGTGAKITLEEWEAGRLQVD